MKSGTWSKSLVGVLIVLVALAGLVPAADGAVGLRITGTATAAGGVGKDVSLDPASSLAGTVTNAGGEALQGVSVRAWRVDLPNGQSSDGPAATTTTAQYETPRLDDFPPANF